ncbi:hypothetical protein XENTR_v10004783 [Xenopus tropicalis]|nr:hypothetical protein XENTR_v10004783 [Xenopus tropicalis]
MPSKVTQRPPGRWSTLTSRRLSGLWKGSQISLFLIFSLPPKKLVSLGSNLGGKTIPNSIGNQSWMP